MLKYLMDPGSKEKPGHKIYKRDFKEHKVIQKKSLSNHSLELVVSNPYYLSIGTVSEIKEKIDTSFIVVLK